MGRQLLVFVFIFSGTCVSSRSLSRESGPVQDQTKIAVSSSLVLLPVSVTDSHGAFVAGLKQRDFQVFEEGRPQNLTVFDERDTPVTIGLIVDHSRSMGAKLNGVIAAVTSFAHSSNPQDQMFVVDFNDDVSIELMRGNRFRTIPRNSRKLSMPSPRADERRSTMPSARACGICNIPVSKKRRSSSSATAEITPAISSIRRFSRRLASPKL